MSPDIRMTLAGAAMGIAAGLAGLAVYNRNETLKAEREHPPRGRFLEVDGVRVHVVERGPPDAPAVVLLHGNVVTLDDWLVSGVVDALPDRRLILIDRPGYGWTDRPARRWGMVEQAALMRETCRALGIYRPVVVGQSQGAMVALAWGLDPRSAPAGLVLVSGYYYPTKRADAAFVAPAAAPVLGPLLRNTLSPPFTRAALPSTLKAMFAPEPVPDRMYTDFPLPLIARPLQLRAISEDGSSIGEEAARLASIGRPVTASVAVLTGDADKVIDYRTQSVRLAAELGVTPDVLPGVGHMAHHAAPDRVAAAVRTVSA